MICRSGFPAERDYLTEFRGAYFIEERQLYNDARIRCETAGTRYVVFYDCLQNPKIVGQPDLSGSFPTVAT